MSNFDRSFAVEGETLNFRFSLIHYPGGRRYWVAVTREEQYLTSFYLEPDCSGTWKLADRYKTAPSWVHPLESLFAEAIACYSTTPAK